MVRGWKRTQTHGPNFHLSLFPTINSEILFLKETDKFTKCNALKRYIKKEAFSTLLTEAENIANSRRLTVDNLSDQDVPEPIMPNYLLLLMKQCGFIPSEEQDGAEFSTWKTTFSIDGNKNVRNELLAPAVKLVMLSSLKMNTVLETRGHLSE